MVIFTAFQWAIIFMADIHVLIDDFNKIELSTNRNAFSMNTTYGRFFQLNEK